MTLASAIRPVGGAAVGEAGGAVWLKAVAKGPSAGGSLSILAKTSDALGVTSAAGNTDQVRLTIAALPGANGALPVVKGYWVAGTFTPTDETPYPSGSPVTATLIAARGGDDQLDHLEYRLDLASTYASSKGQIVLLRADGGYALIPVDEEAIPTLSACNITTSYGSGRTGFTSGDALTVSFSASGSVSQLAVYPFDDDGTGTPQIVNVASPGASGTASVTLQANSDTAYAAAGRLRVAPVVYGTVLGNIQTSSTFTFDEREVDVSGLSVEVDYPSTQTALKSTEQATVAIAGVSAAHTVTANFSGTNYLAPVGTPPFSLTGGAGSFNVQRGATSHAGAATVNLVFANTNNGKTATANNALTVNVEPASLPAVTATVADGVYAFATDASTITVDIEISSTVVLESPGGHVTFSNISVDSGGWETDDGGFTWRTTGTVSPTATRGTYTPVASSFATGAGTAVTTVDGTYRISGFEERAYTVAALSATLALAVAADVPANLTVRDASYSLLTQGVDYSYSGGTITILNEAIKNSNMTGNMVLFVAQTPVTP